MHPVRAVKVVERRGDRHEEDGMQRQPSTANRRTARFTVGRGKCGIAADMDEQGERDREGDDEAKAEMLRDAHRRAEFRRGLCRTEADKGVEKEFLAEKDDGKQRCAHGKAHPRGLFHGGGEMWDRLQCAHRAKSRLGAIRTWSCRCGCCDAAHALRALQTRAELSPAEGFVFGTRSLGRSLRAGRVLHPRSPDLVRVPG